MAPGCGITSMFPIILLFADASAAGFQVVQQFRVAVEQANS
jgi:hypothetical protein